MWAIPCIVAVRSPFAQEPKNPMAPHPRAISCELEEPNPISGLFGTYSSLSLGPRELQRLISKCPRPEDHSGGCPFNEGTRSNPSIYITCFPGFHPWKTVLLVLLDLPNGRATCNGWNYTRFRACLFGFETETPRAPWSATQMSWDFLLGSGSWQCANVQLLSLTTSESRTATRCRVAT